MNSEEADPSDEDPKAFSMLLAWLDLQDKPIPYEALQYSNEPWRSHAANAWVLGDQLVAEDFKKYALSQFITNCALADLDTWEFIEKRAPKKSSLRRFSDHWVAWNHSFFSDEDSEYSSLEAAKLGDSVTHETSDPRMYDLNHWDSPCGDDINSQCPHNPTAKKPDSTTVVSVREPAAEWGYEWETKTQQKQTKSTDPSP